MGEVPLRGVLLSGRISTGLAMYGSAADKACTNGNGEPIDACASTEKEEVHRFIVTDTNGQPIPKTKLMVLAGRVHDALMDVV